MHTLFYLHRQIGTHPPMKMEQTECSEMSAYKIQMPGNYPEESIQISERGKSLKRKIFMCRFWFNSDNKFPNYPLNRWLGGPWGQSGCQLSSSMVTVPTILPWLLIFNLLHCKDAFGETIHLLDLPEFEPHIQITQPIAWPLYWLYYPGTPHTGTMGIRNITPLNPELNPICYLLALLGAHHFLHVSRIRVKSLTFRRLMSYIYIYIYMTLVA